MHRGISSFAAFIYQVFFSFFFYIIIVEYEHFAMDHTDYIHELTTKISVLKLQEGIQRPTSQRKS